MHEPRRTLLELALVAGIGLVLSLIANAVYSEGLAIFHDYRPPRGSGNPGPGTEPPPPDDGPLSTDEKVRRRLVARGLQVLDFEGMAALVEDPLYRDGAYVVVDARKEKYYLEGHIPGAYLLDHFHLDRTVNEVMQACQAAIRIVLYCYGGECEDSELVADDLMQFGIDPANLHVYVGGMSEWKEKGMPVEKGPRQ